MGRTTIRKFACWIILLNTIPVIVVKLFPYGTESTGSTGFKSISLTVLMFSLVSLVLLRLTGKSSAPFWKLVELIIYPVAFGVVFIYHTDVIRRLHETNQHTSLVISSILSISYLISLFVMTFAALKKRKGSSRQGKPGVPGL